MKDCDLVVQFCRSAIQDNVGDKKHTGKKGKWKLLPGWFICIHWHRAEDRRL